MSITKLAHSAYCAYSLYFRTRRGRKAGGGSTGARWPARIVLAAMPILALVLTAFAGEATDRGTQNSEHYRDGLPLTTSFRQKHPKTGDSYLGSKRCRMCHLQWHDSWQDRPHARAWDALKPGNGSGTKCKANLDAKLDYTTDARCLACHAVGFGRTGGYAIPDPDNGKTRRAASVRQAVGCESCHGPGGGFVQVMKQINQDMRPYQVEELHGAGLNRMSPAICTSCHNANALCVEPDYKFDSATMKGDSFHAHFKLRYRRETQSARSVPNNKTERPAPIPVQ